MHALLSQQVLSNFTTLWQVVHENGLSYLAQVRGRCQKRNFTGNPTPISTKRGFTVLYCFNLTGGAACSIPSMNISRMSNLLHLPLNRLSARNCGILEIDAAFLQNYRSHLRKLDLSCNHLKDFLSKITRGVAHSNLTVLLLDHINSTPALGQSYCPWVNISVDAYSLLETIPLMVLSVQANQLGAYSNLNIRKYTPLLKYVDASQNNFNDTSFYVTPKCMMGRKSTSLPTQSFMRHKCSPLLLGF